MSASSPAPEWRFPRSAPCSHRPDVLREEPHAFHPGHTCPPGRTSRRNTGTVPGRCGGRCQGVRALPRHSERYLRSQMAPAAHAAHLLFARRNSALHAAGARTVGSGAGADPSAGGSHPGTGADDPDHPAHPVGPRPGEDPLHRDRPRSGVNRSLSVAPSLRQLLRARPQGQGQWWEGPLWTDDHTVPVSSREAGE